MEVTVVRGTSYVSDTTKINPTNLNRNQESNYIELLIKTKVIEAFKGSYPKQLLDNALSNIDYSSFCDSRTLNHDAKLLLENLIKYQLFVNNIDFEDIDFSTIINRL